MGNMSDIITCNKCGGSGKFIYKSGVVGHCYQCNGIVNGSSHMKTVLSGVSNFSPSFR